MKQKLLRLGFGLLISFFMVFGVTNVVRADDPPTGDPPPEGTGYDEFGYNETANNFNGAADGVDHTLDGTVWGDPTYAQDKLQMKWSEAWDVGNDTGVWTSAAHENNNWNGMKPGGSGESWHYKIVYNAECTVNCIWDSFEVLQSHGVVKGEGHIWDVQNSGGYGSP